MGSHEKIGYHTPLISVFIHLQSTCAHEYNVVFEEHSRSVIIGCVTDFNK